jgi:hypothetical protein
MKKTQAKSSSLGALKHFIVAIFKALFAGTSNADFVRLKNFIC